MGELNIEKIDFSKLSIASVLVEKEKIFFFDNLRQALCKADLETGEVKIITFFSTYNQHSIGKIIFYKGKFFLFSHRGIHISIYDLNGRKEYEMQGNIAEYKEVKGISLYVHEGTKVYIFPSEMVCYDGILIGIVFDLDKEEYFSIKFHPKNEKIVEEFICFDYPTVNDRIVKAAYIYTNIYLDINLTTEKYELKYVDLEGIHLSSINKDELGVWMTQQDNSSIIFMSLKNENIRFFSVKDIVDVHPYNYIYSLSKYVVIMPRYGSKLILIEKKTKIIFPINVMNDMYDVKKAKASRCISCIEINGKIYVFPFAQQEGIIIDTKSMDVYPLKLWCDKQHFYLELQKSVFYHYENQGMELQILFHFLKNHRNTQILKKRELLGQKNFREV